MNRPLRRNAGIALLSVMVVIASVSATASWLLYRQHIDIRRTTQVLAREQAFLFALSAEDFARAILSREASTGPDKQRNNFYAIKISQGQWWSRTDLFKLVTLAGGRAFEGVSDFNMKIYDLQGFMDVNSLRKNNPACNAQSPDVPQAIQPHQWSQKAFDYLLQRRVNFSDEQALERRITPQALGSSLADWLDADDNLRPGGAEDAFYSLFGIPYHAANAPLSMVHELYFINGFRELSRSELDGLAEVLVALPPRSACPEKINVLSAPLKLLEAALSAVPHVTSPAAKASELKRLVCEPPIATGKELQDALKEVLLEGVEKAEEKKLITAWVDHVAVKVLDFKSRYFGLHVSFNYHKKKFEMNSLFYIKREIAEDDETSPVQLLHRHTGPDPYRNLRLHEAGGDANCPQETVPIEEEY